MNGLNLTTTIETPLGIPAFSKEEKKNADFSDIAKKFDIFQIASKIFYLNTLEITETNQISENIAAVSLTERLEKISENIGDELFYALSFKERKFMADTAAALDLGPEVDLERMFKHIEEYEDY